MAGYSSLAEIVDLTGEWLDRHMDGVGRVRVVLGSEPHLSRRREFTSVARSQLADEVQRYWLEERGISLRLSGRIIQAIEAIDQGRLSARQFCGPPPMHAKIYIGDKTAALGSSNFTRPGLDDQFEANARFERRHDRRRYIELCDIASNIWETSIPFDDELRAMLDALLRVVEWREALARAVAELLEGEWAARYIPAPHTSEGLLWPSQRSGIAQALWVINEVGSVLVADATGSGKTRMGAHLAQAVRNRLWLTGRVRRDVVVLVCPPAVEATWMREALIAGTPLLARSHGQLSRHGTDSSGNEALAMHAAQILAVDEAHNFLNPKTIRTRVLQGNHADHVLLLTATPINRGAPDILQLVNLLGADNFDDGTLRLLKRLRPRQRRARQALTTNEAKVLRREIGKFTVRRTKADLNALVDREPEAYRHPDTQRVARYPEHITHTYPTGESSADESLARQIRAHTSELVGLSLLEPVIEVSDVTRIDNPTLTDDVYLDDRLHSVHSLATYAVLDTLRSSRAALIEHLAGTEAATRHFGLPTGFKNNVTGNVLHRLDELADTGPPAIRLDCSVPDWLLDPYLWREMCRAESRRYRSILDLAWRLSPAREAAKAALIERLTHDHDRILAFDKHPITLAALQRQLSAHDVDAIVATGSSPAARKKVQRRLARDATARAVALCSDALNESLNLQGASAVIHLDLPTTLRNAEQRVGRCARMDSPHDFIEVWWPDDGEAFATRANELIAHRARENAQLLGSNLDIPEFDGTDRVISVHEHIEETRTVGSDPGFLAPHPRRPRTRTRNRQPAQSPPQP
ncbi:SNF2-related protein [Saccharopolyspora sp. 5N102]|uniref:SNF2-related protein n=1 Tax=Saccharopolyspora sp. 5N102 TaxID=3375155 RepID=UPI00379DB5EF